jgi:hypothetical protein
MRGERMTQRVRRIVFGEAGSFRRLPHDPHNVGVVQRPA